MISTQMHDFKTYNSTKSTSLTRNKRTQSDGFVVDNCKTNLSSNFEDKTVRETYRLASFQKCKIAVQPYELAVAGFYYVGPGDRVRCYSCGTCVQSWKPDDNVKATTWHTADCKHCKKKDPRNTVIGSMGVSSSFVVSTEEHKILDVASNSQSSDLITTTSHDIPPSQAVLRFAAILQPAHLSLLQSFSLNKEVDRRKSFVGDWPEELRALIQPLARTGFFYLGNLDRTQCFSCGAVQKSWTSSDDVWKIHGTWFNQCRMIRGVEERNVPLVEELQPLDVNSFLSRAEVDPNMSFAGSIPSLSGSIDMNIYDSPSHIEAPPNVLSTPPPSYQYQFSDDVFRGPPLSKGSNGSWSETTAFRGVPNKEQELKETSVVFDPVASVSLEQGSSDRALTPSPLDRTGFASYNPPSTSQPRKLLFNPRSFSSGNLIIASASPKTTISHSPSTLNSSANQLPPQPATVWGSPSPSGASSEPFHHSGDDLLIPSYPPFFKLSSLPHPTTNESSSSTAKHSTRNQEELYQLNTSSSSQDPFALWMTESTSQNQGESSKMQNTPLPSSELDIGDDFIAPDDKLLLQDMYPCLDPDNREMVFLSLRLSSFRLPWPESGSISTITDVAAAGFYYLGTSDHVKCWYCGVEAQKWASHHPAWVVHAQLYPSCQYLLRNRGSEFVEAILTTSHSRPESPQPSSTASISESHMSFESEISFSEPVESGPNRLPTPPIVDPRVEADMKKAELRQSMESAMVGQAMSMGFSRNHIRQVLVKQINEHDCSFQSLDALLDGLVFTPENLIDLESSDDINDDSNQEPEATNRDANALEELDDDIDLYEGSPYPDPNPNLQANEGSSSHESEPNLGSSLPIPSSGGKPAEDREAELRRLKNEKRCKICLDNDATLVFVPCGHICACERCCRAIRQCPLCRTKIEKAYKTYSS